jgi:hypothetical protein
MAETASFRSEPAWKKAGNTDRWTETLFRALAARVAKRWRFVSFRGTGGGEWRGIVDVLAIRKDTSQSTHKLLKSGDLFDIVLVQMKGGGASRPTQSEMERLQAVARRYRAKDILLFEWKKERRRERCQFSRWHSGRWCRLKHPRDIFG